MKKYLLSFWVLVLFVFSNITTGQILTFEFSALAGNEVSASSNSNNANLTSSTITRGAGLTASANGGRFNATNWALTSIANAVSGNNYMEFTITPNSGYQFSLSSIVVQWQRSASGNTAISLRSSVDSYATDLDAVKPVTDGTATQTFTWTFAQSNSTSAVTYRFYSYAEAGTGSGGPGDGTGNDIVVNGTVTAFGTPTLSVDPSSLSAFSYVQGAGPSTSQSYNLSGGNLTGYTDNITITAPTNYEVSTDNIDFGSPKTVEYTTATLSATTIWVRLKAGLSAGNYVNENVTNAGGGATTVNVVCFGTVYKIEPTNHASGIGSVAGTPPHSSVTITWTDASEGTLPDSYLIKASSVGYGSITAPVDGTAESNGTLVKNISQGTQTVSFTGLLSSTTYYFKIFPYTNSGTAINYKTDGSVPQVERLTGDAPPVSIMISHLSPDYSGSSDEFVVLFNNTDNPFDLNGLELQYFAATGSAGSKIAIFSSSTIINGRKHILLSANASITVGSVTGLARDYALTAGMAASGQLVLQETANTANVLYAVAWGTIISYVAGMTDAASWPGDGMISLSASGNTYTRSSFNSSNSQYSHLLSANITSIPSSLDAPLPVELTSFTAKVVGGKVNLNWATATEVNNTGLRLKGH